MTESTTVTEGQAASAPERLTRKRGVGFPVVGLPEAVEIMRKAGQYGSEHKQGAFAGYMGHSTANSGSFKRRIAAFKDWKFIAGGTGDRVVFTELGRRVAYPTDPAKEKQDLQEAFRNCDIFWKVYDESAKGVPFSLETLANLAVRQLGVAPISKDRFAESLAESAVAAGFAEMDGGRVSFVGPGGNAVQDREATEDQGGSEGIYMPTGHITSSAVAAGRNAHARSTEPEEDPSFPTRRRSSPSGPVGPWAGGIVSAPGGPGGRPKPTEGIMGTPGPREEWLDDRPASRIVPPPDPREEGRTRGRVAGGDMRNIGPAEKPAVLHQQSWDFQAGNLVFEIKSSRSLPASAFGQIGKVMSEIEKLKDMLTEKDLNSAGPSEDPAE